MVFREETTSKRKQCISKHDRKMTNPKRKAQMDSYSILVQDNQSNFCSEIFAIEDSVLKCSAKEIRPRN